MSDRPICVIGTGVAALALIQELRRRDATVPITAIASDAGHYSYRPNFSAAMARKMSPTTLITESATAWSTRLTVQLHAFTTVVGIDVEARTLHTTAGVIAYRDLVLATGSRSRVPELGCKARSSILVVDNLPGFSAAYPTLQAASHVAILGAGLVGCELADDLARSGRRVTVFDPAPRALARLVPQPLSDRLQAVLSGHEVGWALNSAVNNIEQAGDRLVITAGPTESLLEVDAVISAAGLVPNAEIAALAGLEGVPAVPVDATMATAQPHIHAIGDVAQPPGGWRPFVVGAQQGARVLAAQLSGECSARFDGSPQPIWVKTRLFPLRLLPPGSMQGAWQVDIDRPDTFVARFFDSHDRVQGYALGGDAAKSSRYAPRSSATHCTETDHA